MLTIVCLFFYLVLYSTGRLFSFGFFIVAFSCYRVWRFRSGSGDWDDLTAEVLFSTLVFCFPLAAKFRNALYNRLWLNDFSQIFSLCLLEWKLFDSSTQIRAIESIGVESWWLGYRSMMRCLCMRNLSLLFAHFIHLQPL